MSMSIIRAMKLAADAEEKHFRKMAVENGQPEGRWLDYVSVPWLQHRNIIMAMAEMDEKLDQILTLVKK